MTLDLAVKSTACLFYKLTLCRSTQRACKSGGGKTVRCSRNHSTEYRGEPLDSDFAPSGACCRLLSNADEAVAHKRWQRWQPQTQAKQAGPKLSVLHKVEVLGAILRGPADVTIMAHEVSLLRCTCYSPPMLFEKPAEKLSREDSTLALAYTTYLSHRYMLRKL